MRLSERWGVGLVFASVHKTKDDRHEHQCRNRSKYQTTDDRAPQWGVLFAALSEAERHRSHADDHGQRRHQNRAEAHKPRLNRGLRRIA